MLDTTKNTSIDSKLRRTLITNTSIDIKPRLISPRAIIGCVLLYGLYNDSLNNTDIENYKHSTINVTGRSLKV